MSGWIEYPYPNAKGAPRIRKLRFDPKAFRMQSWVMCGDGVGRWHNGIKDHRLAWSERAMYNLPAVLKALRAGEPVVLCEGEKDADAVNAAHRPLGVATSHWQGASDFHPRQAAWFTRGSGPIFIMADNDEPGAYSAWMRYTALVKAGVDPARLTLVAPPRGHKDAHDAIAPVGFSHVPVRRPDPARVERAATRYGVARAARAEANGSDWMAPTFIKAGAKS